MKTVDRPQAVDVSRYREGVFLMTM